MNTIRQSSQSVLRLHYDIFEKQLTSLNKKKIHSEKVSQTDSKIYPENTKINDISSKISSNNMKSFLSEKKHSNDLVVNTKNSIFNNPVYRINPLYPNQAKLLRIKGKVTVLYNINVIGKVENIRILYSTPPKIFDDSVLSAMMCWIYERNKPRNDLILTFKFDFH